jgi:hypothetical protein
MATVAISDDIEKVVADKTKPKKNVQFAGFAAGIASVSLSHSACASRKSHFTLFSLKPGMDKGGH